MEGSREWLEQFPAEHQGAIGGWFYNEVRRAPDAEPRRICSAVYRYLAGQVREYGQRFGGGVNKLNVMRDMQREPGGAQAFAAWVIRREQRSPEERRRDKEESEAEGKRRYMEGLPPTQKQLDTLLKLGVDELPANRWRASELIEANKTW